MTKPVRPKGVTDEEWAALQRAHDAIALAIRRLKCPRCKARLIRKGNKQPSPWVSYACSKKCGWYVDRKEPN